LSFRIAKEGGAYILSFLALGAALFLIGPWLALLPLAAAVGCALFFRDPHRVPPEDPSLVIAPADGRVMRIDEVEENGYFGSKVRRISIFMSLFDVHMNYAPLTGFVDYMHYRRGSFKNAMRDIASAVNENNTIGIKRPGATLAVRQIAGLIARRIVCRCYVGDEVRAGEKIGMIKFSSRVDVLLPLDVGLLVEPGMRVRGGETPIARLV